MQVLKKGSGFWAEVVGAPLKGGRGGGGGAAPARSTKASRRACGDGLDSSFF